MEFPFSGPVAHEPPVGLECNPGPEEDAFSAKLLPLVVSRVDEKTHAQI